MASHLFVVHINLGCWRRNLCDHFSLILSKFRELAGFLKSDSWRMVTVDKLITEPVMPPLNRAPLVIALCTFLRSFAIFTRFLAEEAPFLEEPKGI